MRVLGPWITVLSHGSVVSSNRDKRLIWRSLGLEGSIGGFQMEVGVRLMPSASIPHGKNDLFVLPHRII